MGSLYFRCRARKRELDTGVPSGCPRGVDLGGAGQAPEPDWPKWRKFGCANSREVETCLQETCRLLH